MKEDASLNKYLDEVGKETLLTAEQERALSERILAGDERAAGELATKNLRFVVTVAKQYVGQGLELDDLVSEGTVGMLKAAAKYDARKGARFISYAAPQVRQQIEKALEEQGLYKVPKDAARQARREGKPVSVDAPLGSKSNLSLLSVLVNTNSPMADTRVYDEHVEEAVEQALSSLSEREQRVLNAFYGIRQEHETMAEIAEDMQLKRERVRQIRDKAVRKLRKAYKDRLREMRR